MVRRVNRKGRDEMPHYMQDESGTVFTTENPQYHPDAKRLSAKDGAALLRDQTKRELRDMLAGQDRPTVYCVLRDVSRSGMSRRISFFVIRDNRPRCIDYAVSILGAGGARRHPNKDGVVVHGCGMDMGFHVVYALAAALYAGEQDAGYRIAHEWL